MAACKHLEWESVPVRVVSLDKLLLAERDENTIRKDFTPSEAVAIGGALEQYERERAKERMTAGTNQHSEPCGKLPQGSTGKTRDKVAAAINKYQLDPNKPNPMTV